MKRFTIIAAVLLLACAAASAQNGGHKASYDRQVRAVGAAGVGVQTILERWEAACPEDPELFEAWYRFYLAKSRSVQIVTREEPKYLGNDPVLTLKDSTGRDIFYFEDNVYVDSLYAESARAIDRAIALAPNELAYRVDKITSLMLYEKDSPDMATQELLSLVDYHRAKHPEWTYYGLAVDEDTFVSTVQEYCYNFFKYATPGTFEAFKTVSEAMMKAWPRNPAFPDNLGSYWLVYKQKPKQALKWYNKALKIDPKDYAAAKNCVVLARKEKNTRLEKKYLPLLIASTDSETERKSCEARLEALGKK